MGKPLLVFVAEAERQSFHTQLLQLRTSEQVKEWEISLCPRDGKPFRASLTGTIISDWTGKADGLRLCIRDISSAGRELCLYNPADLELEIERNDSDPYEVCPKHVYLKGEMISLKPQTIWVVSRGIVKLSTISETGEEVLVGLAGPSMPFGSNLTTLKTYQATALSEVELACFSLTDIATYPSLAQKFYLKLIRDYGKQKLC